MPIEARPKNRSLRPIRSHRFPPVRLHPSSSRPINQPAQKSSRAGARKPPRRAGARLVRGCFASANPSQLMRSTSSRIRFEPIVRWTSWDLRRTSGPGAVHRNPSVSTPSPPRPGEEKRSRDANKGNPWRFSVGTCRSVFGRKKHRGIHQSCWSETYCVEHPMVCRRACFLLCLRY